MIVLIPSRKPPDCLKLATASFSQTFPIHGSLTLRRYIVSVADSIVTYPLDMHRTIKSVRVRWAVHAERM